MTQTRTLDQLIRRYRRDVLALERVLAGDLVTQYRARLARVRADIRDLQRLVRLSGEIEDAQRWMREHVAVRALLEQARTDLDGFAQYAADAIDARRLELVAMALEQDPELGIASLLDGQPVPPATYSQVRAAFMSIPVEAVQSAVGALQSGSVLRELFDGFGEAGSRQLGEALVGGLARGEGAAQVGRAMRQALDGNASRALTIARTELHRAYRSSSLEHYRAKPDVYRGWKWMASLDGHTCPACVALHESEHALDEAFAGHPNCRCRPVPMTQSLMDIIGDSPEAMELQERLDAADARETGAEWFARQSTDTQRSVVGARKLERMQRGEITLGDVVHTRHDPKWGASVGTASERQAIANAARRRAGRG